MYLIAQPNLNFLYPLQASLQIWPLSDVGELNIFRMWGHWVKVEAKTMTEKNDI